MWPVECMGLNVDGSVCLFPPLGKRQHNANDGDGDGNGDGLDEAYLSAVELYTANV